MEHLKLLFQLLSEVPHRVDLVVQLILLAVDLLLRLLPDLALQLNILDLRLQQLNLRFLGFFLSFAHLKLFVVALCLLLNVIKFFSEALDALAQSLGPLLHNFILSLLLLALLDNFTESPLLQLVLQIGLHLAYLAVESFHFCFEVVLLYLVFVNGFLYFLPNCGVLIELCLSLFLGSLYF